jgi:hypothetical protein
MVLPRCTADGCQLGGDGRFGGPGRLGRAGRAPVAESARGTIDAWLERAARAMDDPGPELPAIAVHARVAIADAARALLDEAARACGSRPFARGGRLDRARRDLELFLLQHRLEPMQAKAGAAALKERRA